MTDKPTMMAATFDRYGSPERLELCRVPIPHPLPGEIRIRVHATTVTRTDTATLRGHPFFARAMTGVLRPKMRILGMDFAGVIDALGSDVTTWQPGERVFGLSPDRFGAHAEYVCVPADGAVARIPDGIGSDAAVTGEGAWYASSTTRLLRDGQRCLIFGASGAIGTAAVQLAKVQGAHVTAVVGRRHLELAEQLGADEVVNYEDQDFTRIAEPFDLVMDAVGKTSWFACRRLLNTHGIFTATDLGPYWSNIFLSTWFGVTGSRAVRVPFPDDAAGFVRHLADLMADGRFRGVFNRSYALGDIVEAFRYVEMGQKTGIVVINVP